jgi:hypothetical protein
MPVIDMKTWMRTRIKEDQNARYLDAGKDFIDEAAIQEALSRNRAPEASLFKRFRSTKFRHCCTYPIRL